MSLVITVWIVRFGSLFYPKNNFSCNVLKTQSPDGRSWVDANFTTMSKARWKIQWAHKMSFCPDCRKRFAEETWVLQHMNQPANACGSWVTLQAFLNVSWHNIVKKIEERDTLLFIISLNKKDKYHTKYFFVFLFPRHDLRSFLMLGL